MKNHGKRVITVLFYLLGIIMAPIITYTVEHLQGLYKQGEAIILFPSIVMVVYIAIGVYITLLARIKFENFSTTVLMCGLYFLLMICTNWATLQFIIDGNKWTFEIYQMDHLFHIWTILFGYFFVELMRGLFHGKK